MASKLISAIDKVWPVIIASGAAVIGVVIYSVFLRWDGLTLSVKVTDVASLLAPLAFTSAVVERVVEILISPWRDAGASKLEKALAAIQARPADAAAGAQKVVDQQAASDALDDYRGITQQYAFAVSLVVSTCVSVAGVRGLEPFVAADKFSALSTTHPAQHLFFLAVDVALSAALLAGGADGIHSIVNAVTSFFDATTDKTRQLQ